jgi:hypothetical protein
MGISLMGSSSLFPFSIREDCPAARIVAETFTLLL